MRLPLLRLLLTALFSLAGEGALAAAPAPVAQLPVPAQAFLKEYCIDCHNAEKTKGEVRLDNLSLRMDSVPTADLWQKVLNQLNSGDMPPEKSKQPARELKANFLGALSETLMVARKSLGDSGGKLTLRRLNKREYRNTLKDLLGVSVDVTELPQEGSSDTFDTVGNALLLSSSQFESYVALGKKAVDEALIRQKSKAQVQKYHRDSEGYVNQRQNVLLEQSRSALSKYQQWMAKIDEMARLPEYAATVQDISQRLGYRGDFKSLYYGEWYRLVGQPSTKDFGYNDVSSITYFGREGKSKEEAFADYYKRPQTDSGVYLGSFIVHTQESHRIPDSWPPGEYLYRYRIAAADDAPWHRRFVQFGVHRGGVDNFDLISTHEVTGTLSNPQILEVKIRVGSEPNRIFSIREKRRIKRGTDVNWMKEALRETGHAPIPMIWVDWTEIEGPLPPRPEAPTPVSLLASSPDARGAREVLERFARKAFRGVEPEKAYLDQLVSLFERRVAHGDRFEQALSRALSLVLASPPFLYLVEDGSPDHPHRITEIELANRLSYFLWSAPPDDTLLTLAKQGQLRTPAVLQQQIDRMIASERFNEFLPGFLHQWLGMDRLDFFDFPTEKHRHFDDSVKMAARQEVYETFARTLRSRGSFSALLRSNQVVINGLLAKYYGIPGVDGDAFRPVSLPNGTPRGGLLGMAAIHAMGSNGTDSSPVHRGVWIVKTLLNDPPPPAPPNVKQISRLESKLLTTKERLVAHQEEPQCASCHRRFDNLGFGLENFDAAGLWRTKDSYVKRGVGKKEWDIDPACTNSRVGAFANFFEMRDRIAAQEKAFVSGSTRALLSYALGRSVGFSDDELVAAIVQRSQERGFVIRDVFQLVGGSAVFQTK